jgi:exopolyphosphatase/guanosine-5'-triphosphate,3'-diphosphate pyrophosphatase
MKSLPFGVVTLTDKFNFQDKENKEQKNEFRNYVNKYFDKLDWLKKVKSHNLIGIGGSITNIGRINLIEKKQSLELLHTHSISAEEFKKIYRKLESETDIERLKEKGLAKEEVDFVVAAAEIVTILIHNLDIKNIIFSKNGVREGLVYKEIEG